MCHGPEHSAVALYRPAAGSLCQPVRWGMIGGTHMTSSIGENMSVLESLSRRPGVRLIAAFVGTYIAFAVVGWGRAVAAEHSDQ